MHNSKLRIKKAMKTIRQYLLAGVALVSAIAADAQTLNVTVGNVTYQFPSASTGDMTYSSGSTLTIMGKTFNLSDITSMKVDESTVTNNLVTVTYSGSAATVTVAGNVAQYVTPTVSGAHVSVAQSNTDAVDDDEITYQLSGSTTDGEFSMTSGSYKCTVSLAGLTMTNPSGAAINIANGKRIQLSAKKNTTNTLTDGANGSQKACIYSKGQLQLQGNGILNVAGNTKHAIKSGDYIEVKNLTLNVTGAVGDGINCEEYFQMKSGTVTISGVGDDGIQCDLGGTTSTGRIYANESANIDDHDDEDSGNIYLDGGTLTITNTAVAGKGVKSEGDMYVTAGTINITTSGSGMWDTDDLETKAAACLSVDGTMTIDGGTLTLKSTGSGGKGMKCDGNMTINAGTVNVTTEGALYYNNGTTENKNYTGDTERISNNYYSSPKGIKSGVSGDTSTTLTINGGTIVVSTKGRNGEGIESKGTLTVNNGDISVDSYDDAINAASDFTINAGNVRAVASGNDGLDANGNLYIKGGNVVAVSTSSPEVAIDANTEGGKKLYITGGNIVAIGGLENGSSISNGTVKQASSYTKGAWYGLYNGSTAAFAFKVPNNSSMGSGMVVYTSGTPALSTGVTGSGDSFWNGNGYTSFSGGSNVSLSTYSGNQGGGGMPGGGGWHW